MWINPSVVALRAVRPSLMIRSISLELKGLRHPLRTFPTSACIPVGVSADNQRGTSLW